MKLDLSRLVDAKPRMVIRPFVEPGCACGGQYCWHLVILGHGTYYGGCVRHYSHRDAYTQGMFQHMAITGEQEDQT